ncbi:Peptidoglycan-associated lipoprotein [Pseudoalteromonas sp. CIP111854]|uniref:Peptidoglycan-associated lipoprotein n=1 Tax=Pseudoalteromonas holothuriae TaxID=2963714 RepID=A0A9W4R146_9GAMM|nr:OmpA family protein [Pseudoalteromonas sp. CIP111854]CAH9062207.1 Peptidoglycan-associated lipoprotein [Pseudoalteromonas sp. CIP111854]
MKYITYSFIAISSLLGGCASWPEEGQGGWAEVYGQHQPKLEQGNLIFNDNINVITNEFEHLALKLELLQTQGIKQCMPAQLLKAQVYENRIRRLISAKMWEDAEHDLIIHYHGLNQLSHHFDTLKNVTDCAPVVVQDGPQKLDENYVDKIAKLLNSDNQFAFDEYQVTPKYMGRLAQASDLIKHMDGLTILLIGHTDKMGDKINNFELALQRADTVKHWLNVYGVPSHIITTLTQGSMQPYSDEITSASSRHSDRRVEAIVMGADELPKDQSSKVMALRNWTKVLSKSQE